MALTGFETFSRILFGWLGRMLTKDSLGLKNQLVKARIPLLPEDYVATTVMQVPAMNRIEAATAASAKASPRP